MNAAELLTNLAIRGVRLAETGPLLRTRSRYDMLGTLILRGETGTSGGVFHLRWSHSHVGKETKAVPRTSDGRLPQAGIDGTIIPWRDAGRTKPR